MEWQKIPRKLRAGMVQINGNLTITISKATKDELIRRNWIINGSKRNLRNGQMEWGLILTHEGKRVFAGRLK